MNIIDKYIDKMYLINALKSSIKLLKKTKIGMKIFIFISFIIFNFIALAGSHFITVILTNLFLIYSTGSFYLYVKIQEKYSEKNIKDNIIKNAGETHSIFVEGVPLTKSEDGIASRMDFFVEKNSSNINDPDYNPEFAKWALNFIIYETVILIPLLLSVLYLK